MFARMNIKPRSRVSGKGHHAIQHRSKTGRLPETD
jgi:hypothetical protein